MGVLEKDVRESRGARNSVKVYATRNGGAVGIVLVPSGKLSRALRFTIANGKIREVEIIVNPQRLHKLDLAVLNRLANKKRKC